MSSIIPLYMADTAFDTGSIIKTYTPSHTAPVTASKTILITKTVSYSNETNHEVQFYKDDNHTTFDLIWRFGMTQTTFPEK